MRRLFSDSILIITILFNGVFHFFERSYYLSSLEIIELFLNTLAEREKPYLINDIFTRQDRALQLRVESLMKIQRILAVAVLDDSGFVIYSTDNNFKALNRAHTQFRRKEYNWALTAWSRSR